jgi:hypothetical protein
VHNVLIELFSGQPDDALERWELEHVGMTIRTRVCGNPRDGSERVLCSGSTRAGYARNSPLGLAGSSSASSAQARRTLGVWKLSPRGRH